MGQVDERVIKTISTELLLAGGRCANPIQSWMGVRPVSQRVTPIVQSRRSAARRCGHDKAWEEFRRFRCCDRTDGHAR